MAFSFCVVQFVTVVFADCWIRLASSPENVLATAGEVAGGRSGILRYLGQASLGASFAVFTCWIATHSGLSRHPELLSAAIDINVIVGAAVLSAFAMVCRTAFRSGDHLRLAIVYAAGKGAIVSGLGLSAIAGGFFMIGIDVSSTSVSDPLMILSITAGAVLNVYAKYLSPNSATAS
jgi:hypothetical protein